MRKFSFLLLLFVALSASAQEFHLIPKIGLNLANITNADGEMKPGVNVGLATEIRFNETFALEPGIFYSMQGSKDSEDSYSAKIKNDYINIPIYAKAYLVKGFHAFAGPQFGFLTRSKTCVSDFDTDVTTDTKDAFNKFDFSLGVGVGYQFDMGLNVSMNYNIGITDTLKDNDDDSCRNGVLQFNVGWRF